MTEKDCCNALLVCRNDNMNICEFSFSSFRSCFDWFELWLWHFKKHERLKRARGLLTIWFRRISLQTVVCAGHFWDRSQFCSRSEIIHWWALLRILLKFAKLIDYLYSRCCLPQWLSWFSAECTFENIHNISERKWCLFMTADALRLYLLYAFV